MNEAERARAYAYLMLVETLPLLEDDDRYNRALDACDRLWYALDIRTRDRFAEVYADLGM